MTIAATAIPRIFLYHGRNLPCPDASLTPEQVKDFYTTIHAELATATVESNGFAGDAHVYEFKRAIGTKG